jgi:hypothetical protein
MPLYQYQPGPAAVIPAERPFNDSEVKIAFPMSVVPLKDMAWQKGKISKDAYAGTARIDDFAVGANSLKLFCLRR